MASLLDQALSSIGVTPNANGAIAASLSLTQALTQFQINNNGTPTTGVAGQLNNLINSNIPPQFRTNPNSTGVNTFSKSGQWEALHYANDLVDHHPKFKFIFKVKFEGFEDFGNSDFFYYVHRCDKPNITIEHQDVNFYNFRSRVMTRVIFQPISITFLDEIGNSVNDFFVKYMNSVSGQASGSYGVDSGFGSASSSKPYKRGYSGGKSIIVNQIFANGLYTNQFRFVNPRIENFQFDELNMEDNAGSLVTMQFSYDSLVSTTYSVGEDNDSGIYTWGNTDILKGGGTSGLPNAGATSLNSGGVQQAVSASGGAQIAGFGLPNYSNDVASVVSAGVSQLNTLPNSLQDLAASPLASVGDLSGIDSSLSTLDKSTTDTLAAIQNGTNFSAPAFATLAPAATPDGFTVLQPGDPLPRNNDVYQRYLASVAASGDSSVTGATAISNDVATAASDGVTVLGDVPGPYDPLPRNNDAYQRYLSLSSADSATVTQTASPPSVTVPVNAALTAASGWTGGGSNGLVPIDSSQLTSWFGP